MRAINKLLVLTAGLGLVLGWSAGAQAEQRRDWIIAAQPDGTFMNLDVVFPGIQASVEHRVPIYGFANQFTIRGNQLFTLPFYESQADLELRILAVTLGTSVGFRDTFRNLTFEPGERINRAHRRGRDAEGDFNEEAWGFWEGRLTLSLPLNDYLVYNNINTLRLENRPEPSFDWRNGIVHDGTLWKSDVMLLAKHRDWGGFGPLFQLQHYERFGKDVTQLNYGFMLVTRPGFRRRNDIFLLSMLFNAGDHLGGDAEGDIYGTHTFYGSFTFTIAYRMVLDLTRGE